MSKWTRNRGYYNSYISSSCYTRNLSSLPLSLFNLGNTYAYNPKLTCVQSHRCGSWSVVVLHSALWILFDPPYFLPWALSLKGFLTKTPRKTHMTYFLLPYCWRLQFFQDAQYQLPCPFRSLWWDILLHLLLETQEIILRKTSLQQNSTFFSTLVF